MTPEGTSGDFADLAIAVPPEDRRRIAMVLPRSDVVAGASVHITMLSEALLARGHDCRVYVGGTGPYLDHLRERRIPFEQVRGLGREIRPHADLLALADFTQRMRRFGPDLIAAHTAKAGVVARVVGRVLRTPVVYTPHGWPFIDGVPAASARRYLAIERLSARMGGQVVVVSEYERVFGLEKRVGRAEETTTIRNGVPDVPASLLASPGSSPPQLIMVARFDEQKDHDTTIRALHRLADLEWSLALVGSGPRVDEVERLVGELGLRERVRFVGESDNVADHLSRGQIFVLTSNWESFPLSILEAMRAGLPTVASDVGGVCEIGQPGVSGLLVDRGDVAGLADALERLITDPALRTQMGGAARELYEAQHMVEPMLERTLALYESACRVA